MTGWKYLASDGIGFQQVAETLRRTSSGFQKGYRLPIPVPKSLVSSAHCRIRPQVNGEWYAAIRMEFMLVNDEFFDSNTLEGHETI